MKEISEKPDHKAIAVLTKIAFPGYYIGAEDVRKAAVIESRNAPWLAHHSFPSPHQ
jgi:hypothetical protein